MEFIIGFLLFAAMASLYVLRSKGYLDSLGTMMSSSKSNRGLLVMALVVIALGLISLFFWSDLVSLQNSLLGTDVPIWWYAIGIAVVAVTIWLFKTSKKSTGRSPHLVENVVVLAAIGAGLFMFYSWKSEDALCPEKQPVTMVPATGMVLDLQSCWEESFMVLDLRQTGIPMLAFNDQSSVLRGRTIEEFAHIKTNHQPGSISGEGRLRFNREEMLRVGLTKLSVFIAPADYQPGATPRFTEADLQALAQ